MDSCIKKEQTVLSQLSQTRRSIYHQFCVTTATVFTTRYKYLAAVNANLTTAAHTVAYVLGTASEHLLSLPMAKRKKGG